MGSQRERSPIGTGRGFFRSGVRVALVVAVLGLWATLAHGQALAVVRLAEGADLIVVTQPLAEATAACWPVTRSGEGDVVCASGGRVGFTTSLERTLGVAESAPPVVVSVGAGSVEEMERLVQRLTRTKAAADVPHPARPQVHDGALVRRLGRPGSDASVALAVALPPASQLQRSASEVLWLLLPELLSGEFDAFQVRLDAEVARLDFRADPDLADLEVRRLRLALAQLGSHRDLEERRVREVAERLRIRRLAALETTETAATALVRRWQLDSEAGVRQDLFGAEAVTVSDVRRAAAEWLGRHPGEVEITLPPRVFNPRFAPGPMTENLDNNLSVAVLERPGADLSALVVRPVLVHDLTGDAATQILARLAARIRSLPEPPPVVVVAQDPPRLELAGTSEGFAGLAESLQLGLETLQEDDAAVQTPDSARSRALGLMAARLGLASVDHTTAAELLRPDNLAIGALAEDAEAAIEALRKFGVGGPPRRDTEVVDPIPADRMKTRRVSPGSAAAMVVEVELPSDPVHGAAMAELVRGRLASALTEGRVEVLRPLVPGRRLALVVIERESDLPSLEEALASAWKSVSAPPDEEEIGEVGRRLAAAIAADAGGAVGRARLCAGVAAGDRSWRPPAESEMALLLLDAEGLEVPLSMIPAWEGTFSTGAGRLPLDEP
jgi:hypothetical protein